MVDPSTHQVPSLEPYTTESMDSDPLLNEVPTQDKSKPVNFGPDHGPPPELALQYYLEDLDTAFLFQETAALHQTQTSTGPLLEVLDSVGSSEAAPSPTPDMYEAAPSPTNVNPLPNPEPLTTSSVSTGSSNANSVNTLAGDGASPVAGHKAYLSTADRRREQNRIASRRARKRRREEKEALKAKAQELESTAATNDDLKRQLEEKTRQYELLEQKHAELMAKLENGAADTDACTPNQKKFKIHQFAVCAQDEEMFIKLEDLKRRMFGERVKRVGLALKRNAPDAELLGLCQDVYEACTELYRVAGSCVRPLTFPKLEDEERTLNGNQGLDPETLEIKERDVLYWLQTMKNLDLSEAQVQALMEAREVYLSTMRAIFSERNELNKKTFRLLEYAKGSDSNSLLTPANYRCQVTATAVMNEINANLDQERLTRGQFEQKFVSILQPRQFATLIVRTYPNMDTRPIHFANTVKAVYDLTHAAPSS